MARKKREEPKPAKAANGRGSVYQRKDTGAWVAAFVLPNGRRIRESFPTEAEARRELDEWRVRYRAVDADPPRARLTIGQWLTDWFTEHGPLLAPTTSQRYDRFIRMLPPQFLSMTLRDIRPATFSKLWRTVAQTPTGYYKDGSPKPCYAAATIYSLRIMLVTAMGPLVTSGLYTVNPASAAKLRTPERKDRRMMDEADIDALLQAMEGDRARAVIITLLTTAMRAGEAMALKWEHVDFAAGTIAIRGNAPHREGTLEIKEPKRRSHRRTLYLPAITRDALLRHRDLQAIERESAGDEWQDLGLVFPNERGGIGRQWATVGRPLKRVLALAKLPDMRVHDLRHNCATLLIERGHNFKAVSEQLGHASTSTTLDIYGHVLPGRGATLAREMDLITGFSAPRIAPVAPAVASETEKTTNQGQNTG